MSFRRRATELNGEDGVTVVNLGSNDGFVFEDY